MNRRLLLLVLCQGFFLTNNVTFITINGLVGLRLAPSAWLATLPVTAYVAGGALFAGLVGRHQRAWGRRRAFQAGLVVAMATTSLCAWAAWQGHFWILVAGATLAGYYNANAGLYRFAAAELAEPAFKERAIAWVLAGGILGAVAGPNLARWTRSALSAEFAGAYAALAVVALASLLVMSTIRFPPLVLPTPAAPGRKLAEIAAQPVFIVAVVASALGYGVMNLLMAATPIAMAACSHPFESAALIKRFGAPRVMAVGLALEIGCVAVALSGVDLMHFLVALFALGLGWNFLFVGGTTLVTQAYRPEEKTTAQAAMDTCIFATMTVTSFSSGALVTTQGWTLLNLGSLAPLTLIGAALLWFAAQRRRALRGGAA